MSTKTFACLAFSLLTTLTILSAQSGATPQLESLFERPSIHELDSRSRFFNFNGMGRVAVPIRVPEGAKGVYYSVSLAPKKASFKEGPSLEAKLMKLGSESEMMKNAHTVSLPVSNRKASVYVIQSETHAQKFETAVHTTYIERCVECKSHTGYFSNNGQGSYYLGIENIYSMRGIKVQIEAVALY